MWPPGHSPSCGPSPFPPPSIQGRFNHLSATWIFAPFASCLFLVCFLFVSCLFLVCFLFVSCFGLDLGSFFDCSAHRSPTARRSRSNANLTWIDHVVQDSSLSVLAPGSVRIAAALVPCRTLSLALSHRINEPPLAAVPTREAPNPLPLTQATLCCLSRLLQAFKH
jgi:hypothetical protein